ncbi:MAG TPA: hypothetical protein VF132_03215, partial [Rudaea sp.]
KDFRTWAATVLAAELLSEVTEASDAADAPTKKSLVEVIKEVADRLGNTPSVCKNSYIHPKIIEAFSGGTLRLPGNGARRGSALSAKERAVRAILKRKRQPLKVM